MHFTAIDTGLCDFTTLNGVLIAALSLQEKNAQMFFQGSDGNNQGNAEGAFLERRAHSLTLNVRVRLECKNPT